MVNIRRYPKPKKDPFERVIEKATELPPLDIDEEFIDERLKEMLREIEEIGEGDFTDPELERARRKSKYPKIFKCY